ncbi:DUF5785 family protein [Haloarchaeobius amylolyticus]|uniref:DUF5785 family protein n=1 Tax=Haloarchaeobius amylolyticus TaxID=1198296 RepID=A0ABD6BCV7_9EURY
MTGSWIGPLSERVEYVVPEKFETMVDIHRAVGNAMRAGDFWESSPTGAQPTEKHA